MDYYLRGTELYKAPENVIENALDQKPDIWDLGCVVCEMLTGKSPWYRVEELYTEDLLRIMGNELRIVKNPNRDFKGSEGFVESVMAKMLMDHPFLADVGVPELPAVTISSWTEADLDLNAFPFDLKDSPYPDDYDFELLFMFRR